MKARLLVLSLLIYCAHSASAQLSGRFYLDQTTFTPGERIYLCFKVSNRGHRAGMIARTGLPDQPLCAGYVTKISRNPPDATAHRDAHFDSCGYNGSLGLKMIKAGKSFTERILLNPDSELKDVGEYIIKAKHLSEIGGPENELNAEATLHLRVIARSHN